MSGSNREAEAAIYKDGLKFGIAEFEEFLRMDEGFPKGSTIVVAGEAGTGKTTFLLEFLRQGVRDSIGHRSRQLDKCENAPPFSVYLSFEESALNVLKDYRHWSFSERNECFFGFVQAIAEGHLAVVDGVKHLTDWADLPEKPLEWVHEGDAKFWPAFITKMNDAKTRLEKMAGKTGLSGIITHLIPTGWLDIWRDQRLPARVVIDPLMAALVRPKARKPEYNGHSLDEARIDLLTLKQKLETRGVTTLISTEGFQSADGGATRLHDLEKFLARGALTLSYRDYGKGELVRQLRVTKMRGRSHTTASQAYRITKDGIEMIGEVV